MNVLLKSWSYLANLFFTYTYKSLALICICIYTINVKGQSIGNYVSNGSLEETYNCIQDNSPKVKFWNDLDSLIPSLPYCNYCLSNVPYNGFGFQYPNTGNGYFIADFFCDSCIPHPRTYIKNRLKAKLHANLTYCVKFYVNIGNNSTYGIDAIGAYFGDENLDTIQYAHTPLSYLTPQIQNPANAIITDTLAWTAITGTFIANGHEKFMVIGNFKSDAATGKLLINPTNTPAIFCTVSVDDVSCVPLNLPAYAGPDKSIIPGDSVFIGREPDFAIDPGCVWYKLPNLASPIATISGMWVKPTQTTSYLVKQVLDCSPEKWDTVVVYMNPLGLNGANASETNIELYPNPADDIIHIKGKKENEVVRLIMCDLSGREVFNGELRINGYQAQQKLDLLNGVYFVTLINHKNERVTKKLVISK